jgi:hypothetical protein
MVWGEKTGDRWDTRGVYYIGYLIIPGRKHFPVADATCE